MPSASHENTQSSNLETWYRWIPWMFDLWMEPP